MEQKTIKAVIPPAKDKAPAKVQFTDGTSAQYWPNQKFGAALEVGVTAECVTEQKTKGEYTNTWLIQWGQKVVKPGFQPRVKSPEEIRSIAAQACVKAACELFQGTGNMSDALKAAKGFMQWHDLVVRGDKPQGEQQGQ